jgi:hypothetical protein
VNEKSRPEGRRLDDLAGARGQQDDGTERHVVIEDIKFSMIPEALLYDDRLNPMDKLVYGCLLRHGDDPANCYPAHKRIAYLVNCQVRSVQRPLRALEGAGWIKRVPRRNPDGSRTSDGYFVHRRNEAAEKALVEKKEAWKRGLWRTATAHDNADPALENAIEGEAQPRSSARTPRAEIAYEGDPSEREPVEDRKDSTVDWRAEERGCAAGAA